MTDETRGKASGKGRESGRPQTSVEGKKEKEKEADWAGPHVSEGEGKPERWWCSLSMSSLDCPSRWCWLLWFLLVGLAEKLVQADVGQAEISISWVAARIGYRCYVHYIKYMQSL